MKTTRLEKTYAVLLLIIFGGIVLHAPFSVGVSVIFPQHELLIKSWKEILMLAATVMAVVTVTQRSLWGELMKDTIVRLIAAFGALHLLLAAVISQNSAEIAAGLAIDLRYVLFFGLVYVLLKVAPHHRNLTVQIGLIGAFVVVGFATLQFFLPPDILSYIGYSKDTIVPYLTIDKNPDFVRVNSTLRGPNPLGAYAGMVLALLAAALVRGKVQLQDSNVRIGAIVLGVCGVVALWTSYSRSALVAAVVAVGIVLGATVLRRVSTRVWITAAVVVFAVAGALMAGFGGGFVSNVLLHENPDGGSAISSNEEHLSSLDTGLDRLISQPFGVGIGSTGSASLYGENATIIENQYLFVAHEAGWLGLALFLAIFILILVRLWKKRQDWLALGVFASGIGLGLIGLLQPVWADDTVSVVWWGLAAIALATTGGKRVRYQTK